MKGMTFISLNQLADFTKATDMGKIRIVKQQLSPSKFRIIWYQLPKARIKKCLQKNGDLKPIYEALEILAKRKPENTRQLNEKIISINALKRFVKLKLPPIFKQHPYSMVKSEIKTILISDVLIKVTPDIIVRFNINGQKILGAMKIHISKNNPFDYSQSLKVATILFKYLDEIKKDDEIVDPNLCFSLDIFGDRIVSAPVKIEEALIGIEKSCEEIKTIWEQL